MGRSSREGGRTCVRVRRSCLAACRLRRKTPKLGTKIPSVATSAQYLHPGRSGGGPRRAGELAAAELIIETGIHNTITRKLNENGKLSHNAAAAYEQLVRKGP